MKFIAMLILAIIPFSCTPACAAYVTLDGNGNVNGIYASPQVDPTPPGYTIIDDADPRIAAFGVRQNAPQRLSALLNTGVTVTSTDAPQIDGTYSVSADARQNMAAIQTSITAGLGLPGGQSTFEYLDVNNQPHAFTAAQFTNFAEDVRDFVYQAEIVAGTIENGGSGTFPSPNISIP